MKFILVFILIFIKHCLRLIVIILTSIAILFEWALGGLELLIFKLLKK